MKFQSKWSSVRIGNNKSHKELSETENIKKFYKLREKVIKFYDEYFRMVHKAPYDSEHGKGLKMLTPKQMLQRSPIALAHVKAGKIAEILKKWNQINHIFFVSRKRSYWKWI